MRIHPFQALRPPPDRAPAVASVPYDTVDTDEARALAAGNPDSFLHVTRPDVDLSPEAATDPDALGAAAAAALRELIARGVLVRDDRPRHYIYRLATPSHTQTGVVTCCHIDDYTDNRIRKHESTRTDKELDRMRHVLATDANTGPVFLTYRDNATINACCEQAMQAEPMCDFEAVDGVRHTIWPVADAEGLAAAFEAVETAYIADGHHRAAAAVRAGLACRATRGNGDAAPAESDWFLAVLFGARQLHILPYNRVVLDLNGHTPPRFLAALSRLFVTGPARTPGPDGPDALDMYLDGRWLRLRLRAGNGTPPVFDAAALQTRLLAPVLGIDEPRTSTRIDFIGGVHGADGLQRLVDQGRAAAAFLLNPVSVETLMATADAGGIMPPKSTWFEPKLRSGLLVHTLDREVTE